jgi:hypothetical protein
MSKGFCVFGFAFLMLSLSFLNGCYKPGFSMGKDPKFPDHPCGMMLEEDSDLEDSNHFFIFEIDGPTKNPNNIASKTKASINPNFPHPSVPSLEQDGDDIPSLDPTPLDVMFNGTVHLCDSKTNCIE